jgi:hypothetical protein
LLFRRSTVFSVGVQTVAALLLIHLVGCASTGTPAEVSTFDTRALDYSGVVLEFVAPAAGSQDVHQRFRDETLSQANAAGMQLLEQPTDRTARLLARLGTISLLHDGYEGGQISMAIPYDFELVDPNGEILTTISGQLSDDFDVDNWRNDEDPDMCRPIAC